VSNPGLLHLHDVPDEALAVGPVVQVGVLDGPAPEVVVEAGDQLADGGVGDGALHADGVLAVLLGDLAHHGGRHARRRDADPLGGREGRLVVALDHDVGAEVGASGHGEGVAVVANVPRGHAVDEAEVRRRVREGLAERERPAR
jgi:hypothetical protein